MSHLEDAKSSAYSVKDESTKRAIEALIEECKRLAIHIDTAYDQIAVLEERIGIQ